MRICIGCDGSSLENGVVLPVVRRRETECGAARELPTRIEPMRLVCRQVQTIDELSRDYVESCTRAVGIVILERRSRGIVVMGVVEADIEAESRGVTHGDIVE